MIKKLDEWENPVVFTDEHKRTWKLAMQLAIRIVKEEMGREE